MAARLTMDVRGAAWAGAIVCAAASLTASGCDEKAAPGFEAVRLAGERFTLELAADEAKRTKGLGGRNEIAADGGMLSRPPIPFVMRDCPVPIDVAFLDGSGRVLAVHEMTPEAPKGPGESDRDYELRLKQYPSGYPAQFAVETAGGRMRAAGLKEGDRVKLDLDRLKALAK